MVAGQFEIEHARFLALLVKARGFGMTSRKRVKSDQLPKDSLQSASFQPVAFSKHPHRTFSYQETRSYFILLNGTSKAAKVIKLEVGMREFYSVEISSTGVVMRPISSRSTHGVGTAGIVA
jgi:hypothetical protein